MNGRIHKPTPKPAPLPNAFARSIDRIARTTRLTIGIQSRITHHVGRPASLQTGTNASG